MGSSEDAGEASGRRDETDSRAERGKNGMLPSKDYKKFKKGIWATSGVITAWHPMGLITKTRR